MTTEFDSSIMSLITGGIEMFVAKKIPPLNANPLKPKLLKEPRFDSIVGDKEVFFARTLNYIYVDSQPARQDYIFTNQSNNIAVTMHIKHINEKPCLDVVIYE